MNVFSNRNLIAPTKKELWGGLACFIAYMIAIPILLQICVPLFSIGGTYAAFLYNISCSVCSFLMVLVVFRKLLFRSQLPMMLLLHTCFFGFIGARALDRLWMLLLSFVQLLLPETPVNMNQDLVVEFMTSYTGYMLLDVVLLAPVIEELLFRGVIFAPLCEKKPILGYAASMTAFAFLHVVSFIGVQHWSILLFSFLQYLPAGFVLCWSYQRSQSIWAPIVLHGLINLYSSIPYLF